MSNENTGSIIETLAEPELAAILQYLRFVEETRCADVSVFLEQNPSLPAFEKLLRNHATNVAKVFEVDGSTSIPRPETIGDTDVDEPFSAEELPVGLSYTTGISEVVFHRKGGLGVVCRGTDETLRREIAIKLIRPDRESAPVNRKQFQVEAKVTGSLDHPGVTPVCGIGETPSGQPFYVMRFLPGDSLADRVKRYEVDNELSESDRAVEFRKMLVSFVSVCKTIAYAHSRGILHRDIKPENIMMGLYGETVVVDWGLAIPIQPVRHDRPHGADTVEPPLDETPEHDLLRRAGTVGYMSPEQALGDTDLAHRSDIYGLGATLYYLLCGQSPVQRSSSLPADFLKIIRGEHPKPRDVCESVNLDLEAICLKAMAVLPQDRYSSGLDLAEDVERFLADEPVSARPDTCRRGVARWSRHHTEACLTGAVAVFLLLLSVTAGLIVSSTWYSEAQRQSEVAQDLNKDLMKRLATTASIRWSRDLSARWDKLEHWAEDSTLHQGLLSLADMDDAQLRESDTVQEWLRFRAERGIGSLKVTSWYVNDSRGRLVARYPEDERLKNELRGRCYAFRSYFHGGLNDRPRVSEDMSGETLEMIGTRHLSAIYMSDGDRAYRVALSVPIKNGEATIGVLAMTINLGFLPDADLIDMRENTFGESQEQPIVGIYLNQIETGAPESSKKVEPALLQKLQRSDYEILIEDYVSPMSPDAVTKQAAIAPIIVDNEWTGLVVIVEEGDVVD